MNIISTILFGTSCFILTKMILSAIIDVSLFIHTLTDIYLYCFYFPCIKEKWPKESYICIHLDFQLFSITLVLKQ